MSREQRWAQKRAAHQAGIASQPPVQLAPSLGGSFSVDYGSVERSLQNDMQGARAQQSFLAVPAPPVAQGMPGGGTWRPAPHGPPPLPLSRPSTGKDVLDFALGGGRGGAGAMAGGITQRAQYQPQPQQPAHPQPYSQPAYQYHPQPQQAPPLQQPPPFYQHHQQQEQQHLQPPPRPQLYRQTPQQPPYGPAAPASAAAPPGALAPLSQQQHAAFPAPVPASASGRSMTREEAWEAKRAAMRGGQAAQPPPQVPSSLPPHFSSQQQQGLLPLHGGESRASSRGSAPGGLSSAGMAALTHAGGGGGAGFTAGKGRPSTFSF